VYKGANRVSNASVETQDDRLTITLTRAASYWSVQASRPIHDSCWSTDRCTLCVFGNCAEPVSTISHYL